MTSSDLPNIALIGRLGVGKTSVAKALVEHYGYTRIALADSLKDDIVDLLNMWCHNNHDELLRKDFVVTREWIEDNKALVRPLLQWFGTEWGRETISPMLWINRVLERASFLPGSIVVDDCRFLNEQEALQSEGFFVARILRPPHQVRDAVGVQGIARHASEEEQERIGGVPSFLNDSQVDSPKDIASRIIAFIEKVAS